MAVLSGALPEPRTVTVAFSFAHFTLTLIRLIDFEDALPPSSHDGGFSGCHPGSKSCTGAPLEVSGVGFSSTPVGSTVKMLATVKPGALRSNATFSPSGANAGERSQ